MILLSRRDQAEATDGNVHKAVWQPACICIPLLRPDGDPRILERAVKTGASGALFSESGGRSGGEQGSTEPAHGGVSEVGGGLHPQPRNSSGVGRKGRAERGLRPTVAGADGEGAAVRGLLRFQE